jgi:cellulose synthase/poly-beta-1,6-N-acetylglucosamine synthase-like glycosyltransferase
LENAVNAYVFTLSPPNFRGLFRQRLRWYRGYLRNVRDYSHMIFNRRFGNLGMFLLPINFVWIFVLGFLFIWPVWMWTQQIQASLAAWTAINYHIMGPQMMDSIFYMDFYTFFWGLFWVLNLITIYLSVRMSGERVEPWKKKVHYLAFMFIYPLILFVFWFAALGAELIGAKRKW